MSKEILPSNELVSAARGVLCMATWDEGCTCTSCSVYDRLAAAVRAADARPAHETTPGQIGHTCSNGATIYLNPGKKCRWCDAVNGTPEPRRDA